MQSVANAIRNTVVVLDRLGPAEEAIALLGWLGGAALTITEVIRVALDALPS